MDRLYYRKDYDLNGHLMQSVLGTEADTFVVSKVGDKRCWLGVLIKLLYSDFTLKQNLTPGGQVAIVEILGPTQLYPAVWPHDEVDVDPTDVLQITVFYQFEGDIWRVKTCDGHGISPVFHTIESFTIEKGKWRFYYSADRTYLIGKTWLSMYWGTITYASQVVLTGRKLKGELKDKGAIGGLREK